jgi:transcriptional regulator with XRE-family HTH domain
MTMLPLKEWRVRKYWTIRKLAKQANVSTETLMRAERGGKVWDITARKIADALEIRVDQVEEFVRYHVEGAS